MHNETITFYSKSPPNKWELDTYDISFWECASIFGESIIGLEVEKVFEFDYQYIEDLIRMPVSERRKQASVLGLLTTRNAIHEYLKDGKKDTFDDLIIE